MITAIYLRVSTDDQSLESQRDELRQVCRERGWKTLVEFTDRVRGARATRGGLDAMMEQVSEGQVARIVCLKLHQLGRSLPHLTALVAELEKCRVALVVPGHVDTEADASSARFALSSVEEFERAVSRERTRAGLHAAKARGVVLGRRKGSRSAPSPKKREAFKIMDERAEMTIEEIADVVGCSVSSAWAWKREWMERQAAGIGV